MQSLRKRLSSYLEMSIHSKNHLPFIARGIIFTLFLNNKHPGLDSNIQIAQDFHHPALLLGEQRIDRNQCLRTSGCLSCEFCCLWLGYVNSINSINSININYIYVYMYLYSINSYIYTCICAFLIFKIFFNKLCLFPCRVNTDIKG